MNIRDRYSEVMVEVMELIKGEENLKFERIREVLKDFEREIVRFQRYTESLEPYRRLFPILKYLYGMGSLSEFYDTGIDLVLDAVGGEMGVLVLGDDRRVVSIRNMDKGDEEFGLSRTIVDMVYERGESILIENACEDEGYRDMASVKNLKIRSLMAVPVTMEGRVKGCLYIENRSFSSIFSEVELKIVELLSEIFSVIIGEVRAKEREREEVLSIVRGLRLKYGLEDVVGESREFLMSVERMVAGAEADVDILITGETGTGKDLFARTIHRIGDRRDGPFIEVNCAEIPENLFESELFGYTRGAFTGAVSSRRGLIRLANRGTLFLNEISEIPVRVQAKLLRVIERKEVVPLGAERGYKVDFRLIVASNRDLRRMVEKGSFRRDLFYRISGFEIRLPLLRERKEDIVPLVHHFKGKYCNRDVRFDAGFWLKVMEYDFPGNVRELENVVRHACIVAEGDRIGFSHLPEYMREGRGERVVLFRDLKRGTAGMEEVERREVMREYIKEKLLENGYNITRTAGSMGISRRHLYRLIRRYGIDVKNL